MVADELLQAFLRRADICLSPTFTGSGTRLKNLEYMAAARPVVSTPKGAEGLDAVAGRDLVIAEPESFARAILNVADAPARARDMGLSGYRFVKERYDWRHSIQPLWRERLRLLSDSHPAA